jgi:hypothetical protein
VIPTILKDALETYEDTQDRLILNLTQEEEAVEERSAAVSRLQ